MDSGPGAGVVVDFEGVGVVDFGLGGEEADSGLALVGEEAGFGLALGGVGAGAGAEAVGVETCLSERVRSARAGMVAKDSRGCLARVDRLL